MSDEDPTEHSQEHIHHEAAHGHGPKWITAAALTAAFLAAFAAVSSSLATRHLTEATLNRIEANDHWSQFQADKIKLSNIISRNVAIEVADPARTQNAPVQKQHQSDLAKAAEYNTKAEEEKNPEDPVGTDGISKLAGREQELSNLHLTSHETYETSATMFHIAIAVVAIAVVAKRKEFWYVSMVGGVIGLYFFASAFAHAPRQTP